MKELQTIIFLVRHGETDFTYVNDPGVDGKRRLNEKGKEQSVKNGQYLNDFSIKVIFSSPMERTLETAKIIKKTANVSNEVVVEKELHEIYDNASWQSVGERVPNFFEKIIVKSPGEQVVCVSHQDVIENTLRALGVTAEEADFPCQMGQMYRLVFAGKKFVQATKLDPS